MICAITSETKISEVLEAYPGLEQRLAEWSPEFAELRNPVLLRAVAKATTVAQAARLCDLTAAELVRKIREAARESGVEVAEEAPQPAAAGAAELADCRIADDIDAGEMLERGVHPVGRVREGLAKLQPGEAIRLKSPFRPDPLIQSVRASGFEAYSVAVSPREHVTYFGRGRNQAA